MAIKERIGRSLDRGFQAVHRKLSALKWLGKMDSAPGNSEVTDHDEEHCFAVPYRKAQHGLRLHTLRYRPIGVPEVNDLPKRKVFHLPTAHHEPTVRQHLMSLAREQAAREHGQAQGLVERLPQTVGRWCWGLATGMVGVGGLVAVWNPIVGLAIVSRSVVPVGIGLLNVVTLEPLAGKLWRRRMKREISAVEEHTEAQLGQPEVEWIVNPLLGHLHLALETTEDEHDPLFDPYLPEAFLPPEVRERWNAHTIEAIRAVYGDVWSGVDEPEELGLGPEDVRWLGVLLGKADAVEAPRV